ncbi:putative phosphoglycerate mutase [Burkholderiales bacterium]|nr:putative phosphoglycerate mutase [Burkholderiales bacterium]
MRRRSAIVAAVVLVVAGPLSWPVAADDARAWEALASGGHALLLRHAATGPGVGDPPGFRHGDCATQRNLSAEGREQARRLGERLASRGVAIGPVLSSRWCRCLDTARLAFGRVEAWTPLDSFFGDRDDEPRRTAEVVDRATRWRGPGTLVLVTHQVNIVAATGVAPAMGEGVVVGRDGHVVGRVAAGP